MTWTFSAPACAALRISFIAAFLAAAAISGSAKTVPYVGLLGGIATLSGDAGSQSTGQTLNLSSYSPANGPALDVFAGLHLHDYVSVQADFIWNTNGLQLNASSSGGTFYQETRHTSQKAAVVSFLLYFRPLRSRFRPYLAVGTGVARLSATRLRVLSSGGSPSLPPAHFSSTGPVLRSHVGIDIALLHDLDFRYSFSETLGNNGISKNLSPPGTHKLANFQNLFGFVYRF